MITLEQFKQYLGVTSSDNDDVIQSILDGAIGIVEKYIGRKIEAQNYDELHSGKGQLSLVLPNYPVNTVIDIAINKGTITTPIRQTVSTNKYIINKDTGILEFLYTMTRGFNNYRIQYNAGYVTIPADLTLAIMKLGGSYYNGMGNDGITSESVAGDQVTFETSQIPADILVILSNYMSL